MRIALGADENTPLVGEIQSYLEQAGHEVALFGAPNDAAEAWGVTAVDVARRVAASEFDRAVLFCWTGTGVSIAANKVAGVRAALCADAETARGARKWNDANVLALSLRATSGAVAREILGAWLTEPYGGTENESLEAIRKVERA